MCGRIGFMGYPDLQLLDALILKARRRGPDSFGIAWMTSSGDRGIERRPTPSWPAPFRVQLPRNLVWGVGHARLTTSGRAINDAQPLRIGDMVFAHNGTVYDHADLAAAYSLPLETGNDSEALARLFARFNHDAAETMARLAVHQKNTPHSFIAALPTQMWVVAWGQPLHVLETARARYVSSWPLPGSHQLSAGNVLSWVNGGVQ
jgi:glutamine phosphoribosylpyrophosphate amidotransferase